MPNQNEIEAGLLNGEFFVEYLPVIDLATGRCVGAEALSRWRRPAGILLPDDFIPLMEGTALSGLLTYFVVERIAEDLLDWLKTSDAFIGINVPPEIIGRGGLRYAAERAGLMEVLPKLVMEITERGVPDQIAVDAISAAADRGVRIALDDVGTGGENILVLSRCKVEIVKVDRDVIAAVRPGEPLPPALEDLAHLLATGRFEVIAEGIETAHQRDVVQSLGIRLVQGFYFSEPLAAGAFKAFFQQQPAGQDAAAS